MELHFSFPGAYVDEAGAEQITWRVEPLPRPQRPDVLGYEIRTQIRGIEFWGYDFDGLEPGQPERARSAAFTLDPWNNLIDCTVHGDLPCTVEQGGERVPAVLNFALDLWTTGEEPTPRESNWLRLTMSVGGEQLEIVDDWFEDGVLRMDRSLPADTRLVCCATCLYSDYSPAGHGLMGMACHRGAKQQYLAVRSKADYWSVPVTEVVMETYLCPEYQRRVPGTGYRG